MSSPPLVSIILPVYNQELRVGRAIESVFAQTFKDWELIVVDDGSSDDSGKVAASFGSERVQVLSQSNSGPYAARNLALQQARCEFVAFIDSDDRWLPQRLELQIPLIRSNPSIGLVFGNALMVDSTESAEHKLTHTYFDIMKPVRGHVLSRLADYNFIPQSSVLVRKACFDKLGGFSLTYPRAADYAKWLQIAIHYELDFVETPVMEYTLHSANYGRGGLRHYFGQTILFEELVQANTDPHVKHKLQKLLTNSELLLIFGAFQEGVERIGRLLTDPQKLRGSTRLQRLEWLFLFVWRLMMSMPRYLKTRLFHK